MRLSPYITALATLIASSYGATGPYPVANPTVNSGLQRHTIYAPQGTAAGALPVLVWGNGACSADGTSIPGFLSEIASYGYLVISQGTPGGGGSTTADQMRDAVSWAANGAGGAYNVDTKKIMTAGYSCGGTEAYEFVNDARVTSIGILNSGLLSNYDLAGTVRKPMIFMLGGQSDIAYGNGERDYGRLPSGTPAWKGNIDRVGHGGTYYENNGGLFAKALVNWLQWLYRGQGSGRTYLQSQAAGDGWSNVVMKSLDNAQVPIGGGGSDDGGGEDPGDGDGEDPGEGGGDNGGGGGGCSTAIYGQCGGSGFSGCTTCASGTTCKFSNDWYSQCLP